jgi:glycerol-3-phosphate acyltransferase PlsY
VLSLCCALAAGFCVGSLPTGYLVARAKGIDIRQHGSGNIGATNVFRTLGKTAGLGVFAVDVLKGVLAVALARMFADAFPGSLPAVAVAIAGAIAAVLGHSYTPWLRFKGGKGVATSLGVIAGLVPAAAAIGFSLWLILAFTTRYVSLASILAAASIPPSIWFTAPTAERLPLFVFGLAAAIVVIARHRANMRRLLDGSEHRFGQKPPSSTP